jgi:hypothetical protein
MITETSVIDSINVLDDGQIQVRRADLVHRDGVEIAKSYHRHVVHPGANLANEDSRVIAIATVVHTPSVIAAYNAARE